MQESTVYRELSGRKINVIVYSMSTVLCGVEAKYSFVHTGNILAKMIKDHGKLNIFD